MSTITDNAVTELASQSTTWSRCGSLRGIDATAELPQAFPIFDLASANDSDVPRRTRRIYIGRHSKQNLIVINDKRISRQHAILVQRDNCLYLRDNGSSLGTYLNGLKLYQGEEFLIRHNDLIGFGPLLFEYRQDDFVGERSELASGVRQNLLARIIAQNTKIQFVGYTAGNVLLAVYQLLIGDTAGYGLNFETAATLVLLLGSVCAWQYCPQKRPSMLMFNGMFIFVGGLLFIGAGYRFTGIAMLLASLEAARGGLMKLKTINGSQLSQGNALTIQADYAQRFGSFLLGWYVVLIQQISERFQTVGRFLDERPFLISPSIQFPARAVFIGKMLFYGNWVGVVVGLLWLSGDGALALNDSKLKSLVMRGIVGSGKSYEREGLVPKAGLV